MKETALTAAGCALLLAVVAGPVLGEPKDLATPTSAPENVIYDAESALEFFKTLSGDWTGTYAGNQHGSNTPVVNFKVVAAGSTVIETVLEGTANEMASVFHMDGDQLLLTHYCALENAPVLRFEKSDKPGEINFVFHGGTNFDPGIDAHFHEGTFQVRSEDTVESTFIVYANGEAQPEGRSVLTRSATE